MLPLIHFRRWQPPLVWRVQGYSVGPSLVVPTPSFWSPLKLGRLLFRSRRRVSVTFSSRGDRLRCRSLLSRFGGRRLPSLILAYFQRLGLPRRLRLTGLIVTWVGRRRPRCCRRLLLCPIRRRSVGQPGVPRRGAPFGRCRFGVGLVLLRL